LGSNFNPQDAQILRVFLRLKFSPALTSAKLKRFEIGSNYKPYLRVQRQMSGKLALKSPPVFLLPICSGILEKINRLVSGTEFLP